MSQRFTSNTQITAASWSFDTSQPWSVCGWLYIVASSAGDGDLFYSVPSANPGSSYAIRLGYSNNGNPTLRWRAGNGSISLGHTVTASLGQWYHLAVTYDGTTARAYLDGSLVSSQALAMTDIHNQNDFGDFSGGLATAEYAQVKVWNGKCLSVGELAVEKAYWTPQTAPGSVYAWWQFDAAAPTLDSSGNSHTLSGPGTSNGSFTPPGQLNPTTQKVAAVGDTTSRGTATVRTRLRIQASGNTVSGAQAFVHTSVPSAAGSANITGGRSRKRRARR
jgi:Laminin G domain.